MHLIKEYSEIWENLKRLQTFDRLCLKIYMPKYENIRMYPAPMTHQDLKNKLIVVVFFKAFSI